MSVRSFIILQTSMSHLTPTKAKNKAVIYSCQIKGTNN